MQDNGLNLGRLPADVQEALRETFGSDFDNASTLTDLFREQDTLNEQGQVVAQPIPEPVVPEPIQATEATFPTGWVVSGPDEQDPNIHHGMVNIQARERGANEFGRVLVNAAEEVMNGRPLPWGGDGAVGILQADDLTRAREILDELTSDTSNADMIGSPSDSLQAGLGILEQVQVVPAEVPDTPSQSIPTAPRRRRTPSRATARVVTPVPSEEIINLESPSETPAQESPQPVNTIKAEEENIIPLESFYIAPATSTPTEESPIKTLVADALRNSATTMEEVSKAKLVSESELRYSDAPWYNDLKNYTYDITIIGAGGIGSWVALLLSKFGIMMRLYDFDRFEKVNQAGQIFLANDVGLPKTLAVSKLLSAVNGNSPLNTYGRWDPGDPLSPITIVAVDNMSVRKRVFEDWSRKYSTRDKALFIDARLAAELYQIYTVKGTLSGPNALARDRYLKEFFTDDQADATLCSYKQTAYVAAMLAGRIINNIVNHFSNTQPDLLPRLVPFFIEYDANGFERIIPYA